VSRWRWWKPGPKMLQAPRRPMASETPHLLASLEAEAMKERQAGKADTLSLLVQDAKRANLLVVAKPLVDLAEELRLTCTGVVINSLDKGRPPPGLTWLEWDGAIEGRLPVTGPDRVRYDRIGVLVEADDTGERGIIHVAVRVAPDQVRQSGDAGLLPVAYTYDLRDAWERPSSLMEAATVQDVRQAHERAANPSPAERDGSPVIFAALGRRFGVVESPHLEAAFRKRDGVRTSYWYRKKPDVFETAIEETGREVLLAVFIFLVMRTARVDVEPVACSSPCKEARHGVGAAALPYSILDLATPSFPGSGQPPGPAHQAAWWR